MFSSNQALGLEDGNKVVRLVNKVHSNIKRDVNRELLNMTEDKSTLYQLLEDGFEQTKRVEQYSQNELMQRYNWSNVSRERVNLGAENALKRENSNESLYILPSENG